MVASRPPEKWKSASTTAMLRQVEAGVGERVPEALDTPGDALAYTPGDAADARVAEVDQVAGRGVAAAGVV